MISIIVPVFNVGPFVEECLTSIVSQQFDHNYEVILIDDCSTDASIDICHRFVQQNRLSRFKILENSQNKGVSATRNRGLDIAKGRYFMFVDPDDCLPPGALATLCEAAEQFSVSIVKGNNTIFKDSGEKAARYNIGDQLLVESQDILTTLYDHRLVRGHPWGKLFRRDLLGSYRFPLGVRMAQDLYYCSEVFSHANSLLLLTQNVYRYRDRDSGSTGRKYESGSYIDWLNSVEGSGKFAVSAHQKRAHKSLLLRTMTQIARECRKIPTPSAAQVLVMIEEKCRQWELESLIQLIKSRLGLSDLIRYIKLRLALRQIRQNLSGS